MVRYCDKKSPDVDVVHKSRPRIKYGTRIGALDFDVDVDDATAAAGIATAAAAMHAARRREIFSLFSSHSFMIDPYTLVYSTTQ
mmetsp:Transcript_26221/g.62316  ORF Transcript_26221/g.62316 Transcript_26221/m.62316 type:complete len:84 (-) Transcript_26221:57-308(-)